MDAAIESNGLVVAALSGGVDSAVAAGLLVEAGHRVVAMTMRLYDARGSVASSGGRCCGPRDIEDARAVAAHLGIPHYVIDLEADFSRDVVDDFVEAYLDGETPNPCVKCNQHIKFTPLLERARQIGAEILVTGHYARITATADGSWGLHRAVDRAKDQAYFLFSMPANELASVRFPLGGLTKPEVRAHAERLGLPNARKEESQEICFVPDGNYAGFVAAAALKRGRSLPMAGNIVAGDGRVVGTHNGTHQFTVGQHKGLGNLKRPPGSIPGADPERLYVTAVDPIAGKVTVGTLTDAASPRLRVRDIRWLAATPPAASSNVQIQIRHRGEPITAVAADYSGAMIELTCAAPIIAAPGQAAVFFDGDRVLGGGWIAGPAANA